MKFKFWVMLLALISCGTLKADPCTPVGKKWHPGHYMLLYTLDRDYVTRCNEIATEPNVQGIKARFSWRDIEPVKGTYNTQKIRALLAACSAKGKRVVIDLEPRSYNGNGDAATARNWLPDYIVDDPAYGWAPFTKNGVTPKIWLATVTDRWILAQQAMAAAFDSEPFVEAVSVGPGESAPGFAKHPVPSDYSALAWRTQMKRRVAAVSAAWPRTIVTQGFNWLPDTAADRVDMVNYLVASHVGQGGPDIYGDASRMTDGQKLYSASYKGALPLMLDVQSPELGGTCGWDGSYTPAQIFQIADTTLGATHIFWIRNSCGSVAGNWTTGILPFIRANALKTTACPKNFPACIK
jgi:hypothetical protein